MNPLIANHLGKPTGARKIYHVTRRGKTAEQFPVETEEVLGTNAFYSKIDILVPGINPFSGSKKKYPLHRIFCS